MIRGNDQRDVFGQTLAQAADVVIDFLVELEELVFVLAVAFVVFKEEVIDPVGRHEDAEKEVPIVFLDVVFERLKASVDGFVSILDEVGFVLFVTEFRIHVDPVIQLLEVLTDRFGVSCLLEVG